jgi:8-oxo-dGTP pyrophosphatase MutT (NUDIX family)
MPDPRLAASILVVRDTPPRLLMARRSRHHRFMPNVLVFPGGAVDEADAAAPFAAPLRAEVSARLERCVRPELAHALAMAAARELSEEVGMSLGTPPALDGLDYLCRAITPPDRAMRFDAHFFVIRADRVAGTPTGSEELEDPGWYSVEDALNAEIALATRAVLGQFALWWEGPRTSETVPVLRDRVWVEE